jgi:hypothetical protein
LQHAVPRRAAGALRRPFGRAVKISVASVGEPEERGEVERLMRTITEEEVDLPEHEVFGAALSGLALFMDEVYNRQRRLIRDSGVVVSAASFRR